MNFFSKRLITVINITNKAFVLDKEEFDLTRTIKFENQDYNFIQPGGKVKFYTRLIPAGKPVGHYGYSGGLYRGRYMEIGQSVNKIIVGLIYVAMGPRQEVIDQYPVAQSNYEGYHVSAKKSFSDDYTFVITPTAI